MIHARHILAAALAVTTLIGSPPIATAQRFKLPASLKDLEHAARRDSNDAAAHYNLALALWNEKRWDDVQASLRTAIQIEPQLAVAHLALAHLPYARRGSLFEEVAERRVPKEWQAVLDTAERHFRQAFLLDPLCDLRIAGAVVPASATALGTAHDYIAEFFFDYLQGFKAMLEGNYEKALVGFERVVRAIDGDRHPDRVPRSLRWWRGIAAAHAGKWDVAEYDLETLLDEELEKESDTAGVMILPLRTNEFRYSLAVVKERAGKRDEAWSLYQAALEHDVGLYMANVQLARLHEAAREWELAIRERQAAVNANPDDASLLYELGVTYARGGRWTDAEQTLGDAVAANPRDTRPLYYLGVVRVTLNKPAEAREAFQRFVSLAPSRYGTQIADAKRRLESLP